MLYLSTGAPPLVSGSELRRLRETMTRCDRAIQRAIERRLRIARRIGEAKRARGIPVRDYAVERAVLRRWHSALERANIPPERADRFARWLVEEAVRIQEELPGTDRPDAAAADVLIIGGAGAMGRWMAGFLRSMCHRVAIYDPRAHPARFPGLHVQTDLREGVSTAEAVVVATPMRVSANVYRRAAECMRGGLLFDILSIKAPLVPEIRRARGRGIRVASVHPLFGPTTRVLSGRNLLVLDCGDPRAADDTEALFRRSSLTITRRSLGEHDRLMTNVLGLPHLTSLLFSLVLSRVSSSSEDLATVGPLSFARQAEVARVVTAENPELSFDIQALNPTSPELFTRLAVVFEEVRRIVEREDRERYFELLRESQGLWTARTDRPPSSHP